MSTASRTSSHRAQKGGALNPAALLGKDSENFMNFLSPDRPPQDGTADTGICGPEVSLQFLSLLRDHYADPKNRSS